MDTRIAVLCEIGKRETNEDACGYWHQGGPICCVLSDGAGGHGGGDVASRLAVTTVIDAFSQRPVASPASTLELIGRANRAVIDDQRRSALQRDMRATLVILSIDPATGGACWGHIGDSRLYVFRQGRVVAQTRDHSLYQSMLDAGFLREDRRRGNNERNVLTGSLGSDDGFVPDVVAQPFDTRDGDAFLMCSDGLWDCIEEPLLEADLQHATSPQDWLDRLQRRVSDAARASQDNFSAIAVWIGEMDFATRIVAR